MGWPTARLRQIPAARRPVHAAFRHAGPAARLSCELRGACAAAGRIRDSFEVCMQSADSGGNMKKMLSTEAARTVRNDRWIAEAFAELYRARRRSASAPTMDRRIVARLASDQQPLENIARFGFHPSANEARLRWVRSVLAKQSPSGQAESSGLTRQSQWLEVELHLSSVLRSGAPEQNGKRQPGWPPSTATPTGRTTRPGSIAS